MEKALCPICDEPLDRDYTDGRGRTLYCHECHKAFYESQAFYVKWIDFGFDDLYSNSDDIPEGCQACGGPYPSCKTSCNIFDD